MTTGDFLRRPINAPTGQATPIGVQPGSSNVLVARFVIVNGAGDGVFVYAPGTQPKLGNPPIAWMGSGLIDPYGNILPSTTGIAASGTFQAGDTIITTSGIFIYLGTPGPTNLSVSIVPGAAGVLDPFGTTADPGVTTYGTNLFAQIFAGQANFFSGVANAGISMAMNASGALVFTPVTGGVVQFSAPILGLSNGMIAVQPGTTSTAEAWHTVTNPTGVTGTIRVKMLPLQNLAVIDVNSSITSTLAAGTSYTAGSLPSSSYYPLAARQFPLTVNQGMAASPTVPRLAIPTSGAISLVMPGFTAAGNVCLTEGTIVYPLD